MSSCARIGGDLLRFLTGAGIAGGACDEPAGCRGASLRGTIVFAGSLAQKPHQGGHTWVFLQYLLGFRRLGWEVLFLDRLEPEMCVDASGAPCPLEVSTNLRYLRDVMQAFALEDAFSVACEKGKRFIGLSREQVLRQVRRAATVINVSGVLRRTRGVGHSTAAGVLRHRSGLRPDVSTHWDCTIRIAVTITTSPSEKTSASPAASFLTVASRG